MKIAGFEIKRAHTAAESVVKVPNNDQATQPSIPLKSSYPRAELGDSGTRILHGMLTEEYNSQLSGIQGIKIYDEMRKSDGTVRAAMLVTTLPIRRATWFIKQVDDTPENVEIADFVKRTLFESIENATWDDVIRQALLMVPFGVMVFEKVYGTSDYEGKTYVTLKKLSPRLPRTIQRWELSNSTFGIQQIRQDGQMAEIPGSKLLIFVNEREGDNWWGTSMLRAAYKHWYYKNNFYKIDAIAFERQGLGVPKITMPQGYTESDERKAATAMKNLRANEDAFLLLPPNYTAEFMDMGSTTTRDPANSINHHNREIMKSVLAQFLELGSTDVGSKALSQDHSDLFLKAMEAVANTIKDEFNGDLIKELVDLNFDNISNYPTLEYTPINKVDVTGLATAYNTLKNAGAIDPTDDDQQYLRSIMGLPERTEEDIADAKDRRDNPPIPASGKVIDPNNPDDTIVDDNIDDAPDAGKQSKKDDKQVDTATKKKASVKAKKHVHSAPRKRTFDDGSGFMSWRPYTFAEQKVTFSNIEKTMNDLETSFTAEATKVLQDAKDAFMVKLQAAIEAGDTKAIADLEIKFVADYKAVLKDAMRQAYEYGKSNASTEMGVATPPSVADSLAQIDLMADTMANKTAVDLETKAKVATANALQKDSSTLQALGAIDLALEQAIDTAVSDSASLLIGQGINNGRNDVFERNSGMIHALQRSEILDDVTCNFCLSMDGLIVDPEDEWAKTDIFHSNCRGIWVEILKDEQELPDVTGVPDNLGDYYGGQANELVQPPRPIVRTDSPAKEEADRRKADKKK